MHKIRVIARLDVKNQYVIKGIQLEGLRKIGDPIELAKKYYADGADEIIFMDAVASLYDRNNLFHIIEEACREVFIPISIGGGLRSIEDIGKALKAGADKISLNTAAVNNPELIKEASRIYGSQCIIGSIDAKWKGGHWEAYIENGREETGLDVLEWAQKLEELGCGEMMITSVDKEGTKGGYDIDLVSQVNELVSIPVIACGGAGTLEHFKEAQQTGVGALVTASVLHYNLATVSDIKSELGISRSC